MIKCKATTLTEPNQASNAGAILNLKVWLQCLTLLRVLFFIFDTISIIKGNVSALLLDHVVFTSRLVAHLHPRAACSSKTLRVPITVSEI